MRKKLLLLLATVAVAITVGRETSAASELSKQDGNFTNQFNSVSEFGLREDFPVDLAFLPPTRQISLAFLPPSHQISLAFLPPSHQISLAFLPPTRQISLAFLPPTRQISLAFLPPTRQISLAFLPPSHQVSLASSTEVRAGDLNLSVKPMEFAMLPLGTETGRHVRNLNEENEKNPNSDAVKVQAPNSVAQVARNLSVSYAMLPLGTETGRHVRKLGEENEGSANSDSVKVQAPAPIA
jgi:hypothetical protein